MKKMELECSYIEISPSYKKINIAIDDADNGDILNHFTVKDILQHFSDDDFLDEIGKGRVMEYFELVEVSD